MLDYSERKILWFSRFLNSGISPSLAVFLEFRPVFFSRKGDVPFHDGMKVLV